MKKNNKESKIMPRRPVIGNLFGMDASVISDPLGSYTGVPVDILDKPVQDADDL